MADKQRTTRGVTAENRKRKGKVATEKDETSKKKRCTSKVIIIIIIISLTIW